MKKLLILFLCLSLIISTTSCGLTTDSKLKNLPPFTEVRILGVGTSTWDFKMESYEFIGDFIHIKGVDGQDVLVDKINCVLYSINKK